MMPSSNLIGQQIHHYEILSHLGGGGMGVVYKAKDTKLGRMVALKFLAPQLTSDPDLKKRFVQEAKAASALDHPNIGTIFEINETADGQLFIAMAYYEGETLKDKIAQGPIPTEQAIDYAVQIAKGLAKAHEADIVHRDIKPANIIITKDDTVKIVDFGLAKMTGETQLTKTGSTIGTIAYMSPEQLKGEEVDHRTDIWSLGVVLYEMVMGERPYKGEYEHQIIYQVLHDEVKVDDVPEGVRAVLERALQKETGARYQEASELLGDIMPSAVGSGSVRVRKSKKSGSGFSGRRFRTVAAVVVILSLLGVGITTDFFSWKGNASSAERVEKQLTYVGQARTPAISPDGELMAYLEVITDSTVRMLVREIEGGAPTVFIPNVKYEPHYTHEPELKWSPDGKMLAAIFPIYGADAELQVYSRLGQFIRTVPLKGFNFSWSPDASEVVSYDSGSLFYVNVNTQEERGVSVAYNSEGGDLAWSPDGMQVALVSTNKTELWLLQHDGTEGAKVYAPPTQELYEPRWSHDGAYLYFMCVDESSNMKVDLCRLAGSADIDDPVESAEIVYTFPVNTFYFTLSADNKRVLYDSQPVMMNFMRYNTQLDRDKAGSSSGLTKSTSLKMLPHISADGKEITYLMQNVNGFDLYSMASDGSNVRQRTFTGGNVFGSLDKSKLVQHGDEAFMIVENEGRVNLLEIDLSTGKVATQDVSHIDLNIDNWGRADFDWDGEHSIVYPQSKGAWSAALSEFNMQTGEVNELVTPMDSVVYILPKFSPDRNRIAFLIRYKSPDEKSGIWILDIETGHREEIYRWNEPGYFVIPLRWSLDGNYIFALSIGFFRDLDTADILAISVDDGTYDVIASIPESYSNMFSEISPDGKFFVASISESPRDIWMIENFDPEVD